MARDVRIGAESWNFDDFLIRHSFVTPEMESVESYLPSLSKTKPQKVFKNGFKSRLVVANMENIKAGLP